MGLGRNMQREVKYGGAGTLDGRLSQLETKWKIRQRKPADLSHTRAPMKSRAEPQVAGP
jgi:hypothetical protein